MIAEQDRFAFGWIPYWDQERTFETFIPSPWVSFFSWLKYSRSMEAKLKLRYSYSICSIRLWRLGSADADVGKVIRRATEEHQSCQTTASEVE